MTKKALLLLYPDCVIFEVMLISEILSDHVSVVTATPDNQPIHTSGVTIQPDLCYSDVAANEYSCVLVPGGGPDSILTNPLIDQILQTANAQHILIGGICAGVLVLAKSGILTGRVVTHNYTPRYASQELVEEAAPFWKDITYVDQPLVRDENIITAMPYAYIDFAMEVATHLGLYSEQKARQMAVYYRGQYPF